MWIKKDDEEMVNLDHTQSILMEVNNENKKYRIIFYQRGSNEVKFSFDTETEVREYYSNLQDSIAIEIKPKLNI